MLRPLLAVLGLTALLQAAPDAAAPAQVAPASSSAASPAGVPVHWLDTTGSNGYSGTTWGVPWPQGTIAKSTSFALQNDQGEAVPVQSWITAYWPDGSVKWTAHATPANLKASAKYSLLPGATPATPATPLKVTQAADALSIDTGVITVRFATDGKGGLFSLSRGGKDIASGGQLIALIQNVADSELTATKQVESLESKVEKVELEQSGPVRAVVKVTGRHVGPQRQLLPFTLRFYVYAGGESVRVMHTFIYDADEFKDYIKGLGFRFQVPLSDELYNRHIRFVASNGGVFGEAVKTLTGLRRDSGDDARANQVAGRFVPNSSISDRVYGNMQYIPAWGDFSLFQADSNAFRISKRTSEGHGWIDSDEGVHATGTGFLGGAKGGGIVFTLRNFWQSYPSGIDIRNAASALGEVTLWFWSPRADAMDMRFYHDGMGQDTYEKQTKGGLEITYEDYEPGFGTPNGIARTSELTLWAEASMPSRERLVELAAADQTPALLVCEPARFLEAHVFGGLWTLPDRSSPAKAALENRLDFLFDFYHHQVEQRHWYGFWNYGDFMHTYDLDRHVWRYDVGGFAWDNSELSPDLWLWLSFLRTGRADIFRFSEALTRHTGEVDSIHSGRFAGLGSRHNVQHWGCSSKQARISTAAYRRYYYFLTADERVGDLLRDNLKTDLAYLRLTPTRKLPGQDNDGRFPARVSWGTDWCNFAAAFLTEWERTGDPAIREKLFNGMRGIGNSGMGFFTVGFGYDPATGKMTALQETSADFSHLNSVFGAFETCAELIELTKNYPDLASFDKAWLKYCSLVTAPNEEQLAQLPNTFKQTLLQAHTRLTAYAAFRLKDDKLARRAWAQYFQDMEGRGEMKLQRISGSDVLNPVDEVKGVSTNGTAQGNLATIQNLALIGNYLDQVVGTPKADKSADKADRPRKGEKADKGDKTAK